jgi:hypothetical protein
MAEGTMIKESLQVACPRCGAAAGEKCVSLKGGTPVKSTHTARDFTYLGKPLSSRWLPPELKPPKPPSKLAQERALADDLAAVLERTLDQLGVTLHRDAVDALARYREARWR